MSKPEPFEQVGPLGDGRWSVEFSSLRHVEVMARDAEIPAWVPSHEAQHLRDFARALDRAADALEAATEPPPDEDYAPVDADLLQALKDSLRVAGEAARRKGKG